MQLRVLFGGKLAASENDYRNIAQLAVASELFEHFETAHVRKPEVENNAIAGRLAKLLERFLSARGGYDLDVVVTQKLRDAEPLGLIVLDHHEPLVARLRILANPAERGLDAFCRRRLGHERERSARQAVLPVVIQSDDLNGDVARQRVLLELTE